MKKWIMSAKTNDEVLTELILVIAEDSERVARLKFKSFMRMLGFISDDYTEVSVKPHGQAKPEEPEEELPPEVSDEDTGAAEDETPEEEGDIEEEAFQQGGT
jgi:hypothetical protein